MDYSKLFNLDGQTAIITGSARGNGKEIAMGLASVGANIVLTDILLLEKLQEVAKEIEAKGVGCLPIQTDVSEPSDVKKLVEKTVDKFGNIDILVNNAGIMIRGKVEEWSKEDWRKILDVNLIGPFLCAKEVFPIMKRNRKGKIINIASIDAVRGFPGKIGYGSSKGGLLTFTKQLAVEWAEFGINVNAICPGLVETPMSKDLIEKEGREKLKLLNPMRKILKPGDLVGAVIFLASAASDLVTGHALYVDGGMRS